MKLPSRKALLPLATFPLFFLVSAADQPHSATLTEAIREVNFRSGSDRDQILAAEIGLELRGRDILTTGTRSRAELLFENNVLTRLGSNTIFSFEPDQEILDLEQGLALIRVPKGSRRPVQLRTPAATAAITGTTCLFSVQPEPDSDGRRIMKLAVLEGSLEVTYPNGEILRLTAGQMAISSEGDQSPPAPVDVDIERLVRTSAMVNDFERELGSESLLERASNRQDRAIRSGLLAPSGLIINGAGTEVQVEREREPFDLNASSESNRDRVRRNRPELFPDDEDGPIDENGAVEIPSPLDPKGLATLQQAPDQPGKYLLTTGDDIHLSTDLASETGELLTEHLSSSAQAFQEFEQMRLTGELSIDQPLIPEFLFVADGTDSPALTVQNLTVLGTTQSSEIEARAKEFSPLLGFFAPHGSLEVGGANHFSDLDDLLFASGESDVIFSEDSSARVTSDSPQARSLLLSEQGTIQIHGTYNASGEGNESRAGGGSIVARALGDIHLGPESRLSANMSQSENLFAEMPLGGTIDLNSLQGQLVMEGEISARGGTSYGTAAFQARGGDGLTLGPGASIDVSAIPNSDNPYAFSNGGDMAFLAGGDLNIFGDILANASPYGQENRAGMLFFNHETPNNGEILFQDANIEATGGAGGSFRLGAFTPSPIEGDRVLSEPEFGTFFAGDLSMVDSAIDVSGDNPWGAPQIEVQANSIELDQTVLTANTNAATESDFMLASVDSPTSDPNIHLSTREKLIIRNSSQLAALVNGGDSAGGRIFLESREGDIRVEGTEGLLEPDTVLESGSIRATASNIAVVDSKLHAFQGNINLTTGEEGQIEVLRSILTANNEIFLQGGTVLVNDSNLSARDIIILRNQGNFEDRAGAESAGNTINGDLYIDSFNANAH